MRAFAAAMAMGVGLLTVCWGVRPPHITYTWVCRPNINSPAGFDFYEVTGVQHGDAIVMYEDECPAALGLD